MKKLLVVMICIVIAGQTFADDASDVFIAACPVCDCETDDEDVASRNTYAGARVYQNARAAYSYRPFGGQSEKENKDNMGFGTTMGLRFNEFLRGEYETLYMGANFTADDQHFRYDLWANMFNGYLYWEFCDAVAPYIGGGIGLTAMWGAIDGTLSSATKLSYQGLVGVLFELGPAIELEFGFKYINFGKIDHARGTTSVDATQFYLGAIYRFGV